MTDALRFPKRSLNEFLTEMQAKGKRRGKLKGRKILSNNKQANPFYLS